MDVEFFSLKRLMMNTSYCSAGLSGHVVPVWLARVVA